ncbi:MAG TPA: ABC transporter ATP-binding protein, partial [bacterium]|nr:ABC transporter ATP-binding protein [bacterium]
EILLGSTPLSRMSRHQIAREIAVVPQDTSLGFPFSVLEVVLMGRNPFTGMLGLESEQDYKLAFESMERLDIIHLAERRFDSLSGGEKQRTVLARALTQTPHILLLDEPGTHLDLSHQIVIHEILQNLSREGITVLSITHDLNLAAEFFPRMIAMKQGRLIADGLTEEVLTESCMQEVFGVRTFVDKNPISGRPRISILKQDSVA